MSKMERNVNRVVRLLLRDFERSLNEMIAARMPSVEARPFLLPQTPVVADKEKQWDGERLVRFRKRHRLKQQQLALLLEVSLSSICRWEKEKFSPRRDTLRRLSELRKMSVDELQVLLANKTTRHNHLHRNSEK